MNVYGSEAWARKDGELVTYTDDPSRAPRAEPNRFDGPASGVVPDIVVPTTRADRRAGRDPVLTVLARLS